VFWSHTNRWHYEDSLYEVTMFLKRILFLNISRGCICSLLIFTLCCTLSWEMPSHVDTVLIEWLK